MVPGGPCQNRLQTLALESGPSENETVAPFAFRKNPAEPLFHQGLQGCPISMSQLANLLEEAVRYLYGCFHMADHIILDTQASRWPIIACTGPNSRLPILTIRAN